jgi:hypothetical protein
MELPIGLGGGLPDEHMGTQGQTHPHKQILVTMCYMYTTNKMSVLMKLFLLHINMKNLEAFWLVLIRSFMSISNSNTL